MLDMFVLEYISVCDDKILINTYCLDINERT